MHHRHAGVDNGNLRSIAAESHRAVRDIAAGGVTDTESGAKVNAQRIDSILPCLRALSSGACLYPPCHAPTRNACAANVSCNRLYVSAIVDLQIGGEDIGASPLYTLDLALGAASSFNRGQCSGILGLPHLGDAQVLSWSSCAPTTRARVAS